MKHLNFPQGSPFSIDQKTWISGFLSGVESKILKSNSKEEKPSKETDFVNFLYGSQTGTSENLAEEMLNKFKSNGLNGSLKSLSDISLDELSKMKKAFFVISTYGEGEMPDNAQLFWEDLNSSSVPDFSNVEFGVLALGDTSYEEFCHAGKLLDMRMEQVGAKRIIERVDCDVDYEELSTQWGNNLITLLQPNDPKISTNVRDKVKWNRKNPFSAKISENYLLSGKNSNKEIRHYEIDLSGSELTYEVGDSINIFPVNNDKLVHLMLKRLNLNVDDFCNEKGKSFFDLFKYDLDISIPSRDLLNLISDSFQIESFTNLISSGDKNMLDNYLYGKDILDLTNIKKSHKFDPLIFIKCLRPLQHRAYSIASSPNTKKDKVQITVSTIRWENDNRDHEGICSTFLSDRISHDEKLKVFITANNSFRLPQDDDTPIIMVGPGTGVAPFKAFIEERDFKNSKGKNWLFFGDQTKKYDFIYEQFFSKMLKKGILNRLDLAFSRDQKEKIYVQSKMIENGKSIFEWLENGAYFYVCGDASKMAKDVEDALFEIIKKNGGFNSEKALEYLNNLKRNKRYLRDVY